MSVYAAREIYRFARLAGFSPDQAVTMTAIALAESGGNSGAHNPNGEDSRGLWQINARAHPALGRTNLYDPLTNARAAYEVSGGGRDVSAWTTTHGGTGAPYVAYRAEAVAAAGASHVAADGVFTGTEGYGHPLGAGSATGAHPTGRVGTGLTNTALTGADPVGTGHPAGDGPLRTFLDSAQAQDGDHYVWGADPSASDADPNAFDCSGLVHWAAGRAGVDLPEGSWNQYLALQHKGATISVEQALHTPGALLFTFSTQPTAGGGRPAEAHVAISLGNGHTVEAQSTQTGVGEFEAGHRFNYAAVIPGISQGTGLTGPLTDAALPGSTVGGNPLAGPAGGIDSDHDGLTDVLEARLGLSVSDADTDHDGVSDGYELLRLHTNPLLSDSDGDHISDSLELALGTNPLTADSNHDGQIDGARNLPGGTVDTDHDGLSDMLERILHTDPTKADSDGDGFVDGAEYRAGFDPASATSNPLAKAAGAATGTDPVTAAGLPGTDPTAALPHHLAAAVDPDPSWGLDSMDGLGH